MVAPAFAAQANAMANPVSGLQVLRVVLGLGAVLALLLAGLWVFKRLGGKTLRVSRGQIRVLSSLSVGNRARLLLVDVQGTRLLLGAAPQRVELITRLDQEPEHGDQEPGCSKSSSFMGQLAQHLQARSMKGPRTGEEQIDTQDGHHGGDSPRP